MVTGRMTASGGPRNGMNSTSAATTLDKSA